MRKPGSCLSRNARTRIAHAGRRDATAATATAATEYVVDYHVVPERLTPGFDEHLSNHSLAGVQVALAVGFAAATLLRSR
jgi:hypothetical protein